MVFVPPKVESPVPPWVTARSVPSVRELVMSSVPTMVEDDWEMKPPETVNAPDTSKATEGVAVPTPILLFETSIYRVLESKFMALPEVSRVMFPVALTSKAAEFNVVAPPSAIVKISSPLSWNWMMLSVPLWLTRRPTLSECVWSSNEIAVMLSGMYFICVLLKELTEAVLLLARMNDSRESSREFEKERF